MDSAEWDGFGPWVREVCRPDEVPPLFRGAGIEPEDCRLVLKVPRSLDRRNARPDMDLYDHLIAVEEETLAVLSRRDGGYDAVRLPFDHVVAIEDSVCLLDGRLGLHTADGGMLVIPYNGASRAPMQRLAGMLRGSYLPFGPEPLPPGAAAGPYLGGVETGLVNAYRRIVAREPELRLVTATARRPGLRSSITLSDGREVLVIHRRDWFGTSGDDYSVVVTVVPRPRIAGTEVRAQPRRRGVCLVSVQVAGARLRFPVPDGPELDAFLAALSHRGRAHPR
ncbi:hypothetical protein GCM10010168_78130 [Actinoplanes ianthinogenes]|uniref:ESX secretion-associated protein EspG n=1 Tax=Actinoplanes ianthinogenes TaxID=122358 RepID=A0ABM7LKE8_9ACTN|nr:hypothetical protein [Actinoplanes ianthinogenes]BCJ39731.1 hypothetical protein Aiant_03880 [Actinoplanes ianthinogenes]GGR47790.1 hypothetical protein GCM10010168_78130 [Actinoplanes ianthinogenes]